MKDYNRSHRPTQEAGGYFSNCILHFDGVNDKKINFMVEFRYQQDI